MSNKQQIGINSTFVTSAVENELGQIASSTETGEIQWPRSRIQFTGKHPMNEQMYNTGRGVALKLWLLKYHHESCWGLQSIPTSSQSFHVPTHRHPHIQTKWWKILGTWRRKKTDSELYIVVMGSTRIYGITQTVFHKICWFAHIACKPQITAPHW